MRKIAVVAAAEFNASVRSKAFVIGLILLPILMIGGALVQRVAQQQVDRSTRRLAVLDHTGALTEGLARRAELWNTALGLGLAGPQGGPRFEVVPVARPAAGAAPAEDPGALDRLRLELSSRVRRGELFAFVEIPADVLGETGLDTRLAYHSDHPTVEDLPRWLEISLNDEIRLRRFQGAGLAAELVVRLDQRVPMEQRGLFARAADGHTAPAARVDKVRAFAVPVLFMFLLFTVVMTGAPQLLNTVLEEKMSRISEVMLGSVTPFELMTGKLVGSAGVSTLLAFLYVGGGLATAAYTGHAGAVPLGLIPWFALFLGLSVFLFGSLFIAIGAACSDLKDTQNLMMPVMLLVMVPLFTWQAVLRAPAGDFAVAISLFPPATPFLMLLRIALHPGPAAWEVALGVLLSIGTTIAAVWASGKIFRTGLLMQGKGASLAEMVRWVARG